jgi:cytochrome oxidase Cu insertion factor (SCO1/SenC/PrrC family)
MLIGTTTEREFANLVSGWSEAELLPLLSEAHPVYEGRGEQTAVRMRGYALACLANLPSVTRAVLPFVRDELTNAMHPYPAAVAAQVLLKADGLTPDWKDLLEFVHARMKQVGMPIVIGRYPLDIEGPQTTAAQVIQDVLNHIQFTEKRNGLVTLGTLPANRQTTSILDTEMEDHAGESLKFREFYTGKPSFVVFFYTRCNNPQKCSANIWRWGELVRAVQELGLEYRTSAISYDPAFDSAERLRNYALDRQVPLSDSHRVFRVPGDFIAFRRSFALNVGYSQTTVNQHATEAFVLDANGKIAHTFVRATWSTGEVIEALKQA